MCCRYWEAVKHWDEALQLTPTSAVLYEMKSQVCVCVHARVRACVHVCVDLMKPTALSNRTSRSVPSSGECAKSY